MSSGGSPNLGPQGCDEARHCGVNPNPSEFGWLFMENLMLTQQIGTDMFLERGKEKLKQAFMKNLEAFPYLYRNI